MRVAKPFKQVRSWDLLLGVSSDFHFFFFPFSFYLAFVAVPICKSIFGFLWWQFCIDISCCIGYCSSQQVRMKEEKEILEHFAGVVSILILA